MAEQIAGGVAEEAVDHGGRRDRDHQRHPGVGAIGVDAAGANAGIGFAVAVDVADSRDGVAELVTGGAPGDRRQHRASRAREHLNETRVDGDAVGERRPDDHVGHRVAVDVAQSVQREAELVARGCADPLVDGLRAASGEQVDNPRVRGAHVS